MKSLQFEPSPSYSVFEDVSFFDEYQRYAISRIISRIVSSVEDDDNSIIKIDAPGGFGKTHMLRVVCSILDRAGIETRVATFTGRAASQVAKDGLTNVSTLHRLLLDPVIDSDGNLLYFKDKNDIEVAESIGEALICDEASMIPREMFMKMKSICNAFGIKFIIVGDQAQLPSIEPRNSEPFDLLRRDDMEFESLKLVTNYRQKEGSAIADLCMHLRDINSIPRKKATGLSMVSKSTVNKLDFHKKNRFDAIICGVHKTRKKMNDLVRRAMGYHEEWAEEGEIVICKRNDIVANVRINNGELYEVVSCLPTITTGCHTYLLKGMDSDKTVRVNVPDACWGGDLTQGKKMGGIAIQQFEFGYAMTCHSAQGSQFDNLLYIDEDVSYFLSTKRFRYTAISRARKNLTIAM